MTPEHFNALLKELIDENPFAIRAALKILDVEFTESVPTLAVTCETRPRMKVNLSFLAEHAHTEAHVKAVIVHEFLHVLLRHTEGRQPLTPSRHLAFDAIINAIIHRQYGPEYSSMMSRYYGQAQNLQKLLRPMNEQETAWFAANQYQAPQWAVAWDALYAGKLIADDIQGLAETLSQSVLNENPEASGTVTSNAGPFTLSQGSCDASGLIGNHDDLGEDLEGELSSAMDSALKQMNGSGIWRSGRNPNIGGALVDALIQAEDAARSAWDRKTLAIIRKHITPDSRSRTFREELWSYRIPVLSTSDRRAFLKAQWSPFLPEAAWEGLRQKQDGTAQVYLDVSGSMDQEMPAIIGLLNRLGRHIRRPFWAFSNEVAPAVIERGQLRTSTTGGTSMECVLRHVARTRPDAAIVVTDGFIEDLDKKLAAQAAKTRLHVIVTRDGSPKLIADAGMPYTQLEKIPK